MNASLTALLEAIWRDGEAHDLITPEHDLRMLHITPDTGRLLALLVRLTRARSILELGTSDAYSTLWFADAVHDLGGHVTTVERSPWKATLAREHLSAAGLSDAVTLVEADAKDYVHSAAGPVDFVFLDAERSEYLDLAPHLARILRPGGLWVTDNAVSHAHELGAFFAWMEALPGWYTTVATVGKGEHMALKPWP